LRFLIADCRLAGNEATSNNRKSTFGNRQWFGGTERTRTVIGLIDNQVPHLSATVPEHL
jgi:hypothetical protein